MNHNENSLLKKDSNKIKIKVTHLARLLFFILLLGFVPSLNAQSNEDCLTCHEDNTLTTERKGKEISLYVNVKILQNSAHRKLTCVSCHVGFNAEELPHKEKIEPINCRSCHRNATVKHPFHPQIRSASGTNGPEGSSCKSCHGTHDVVSVKSKNSKWSAENLTESCGSCHKEVREIFLSSQHYQAYKDGISGSPNCLTCHNNALVSKKFNGDTLQIKIAQEKLCLSCHLDDPEIRARTSPSAGFIMAYEKSVHGSSLTGGNAKAATCVDCHTSHGVLDGNLNSSSVNRFNIPVTCGKCHSSITTEFNESIHGVSALQKGNREAPVCTDCHGEHNILKHDDPLSPVEFRNVSKQVCAPCHTSVRLSEKYGFPSDRFKTFSDSYHGLAIRGGLLEVANCVSCHSAHNIKSHLDSTSATHKSNLVKTCGSCHPGANANFTVGRIHVSLDKEEEPLLYWIAYFYISLIIVVIGLMLLHNIIDLIKKAKIKKLKQVGHIESENHGHALYLRMTLNERIQHGTMALSFIILVITGFMLRYPESWWVTYIRKLSEDAFVYRSLLHRIAAVIMVSISLYHIYYISFTKRGKQLFRDLLPKYQDIIDALGVAKFNLGISKEKPMLDRFSYVEKAEYWALIWGTIVMTITGFILWFDNTFMGLLTKLGWDAARTIHYYEAWLAFLAIVVWHFYFVIFNPDIYPMNTAWLTGKIPEEQMAEEHPKELERIKMQQAQLEAEDSYQNEKENKSNDNEDGEKNKS